MAGTAFKSSASILVVDLHDSAFLDQVMKEEDWRRHRSASTRHRLQPLKMIQVMLGFWWVLLAVALLGVAVGLYSTVMVQRFGWPCISLQAVQAVFSAITFALTLLLVFRTNSAFSRWWEARKEVGTLSSLSHNIVRKAVAYFPADQPELVAALARWTAAGMFAVKGLVRPSADLRQELGGVLLPQEREWLLEQPQKAVAVGQALSSIVLAANVDEFVRSRFDSMISLYTFVFGGCNRIYNTAIPTCFTRLTSRFLTCYFVLLPFFLWPMCGWATPGLAVIITFLLLCVEHNSIQIEEPFHVIAFETFCQTIHKDIQNILKMHGPHCGGLNVPVIGGLNSPATAQNRCQAPLNFSAHSLLEGDGSSSAAADSAAGRPADAPPSAAEPHSRSSVAAGRSRRWSLEVPRRPAQQLRRAEQSEAELTGAAAAAVVPPKGKGRVTAVNSRTCLMAAHHQEAADLVVSVV